MRQIPLWKVKREFQRAVRQLLTLPAFVVSFFLSTPFYDFWLSRKCKTHTGELSAQTKVAIYLVFPKNGLLESHFLAIEYMIASGYAPLIVSNLPLSDADRIRLLKRSWRIIERPNYGYDFGGYRDAVLSLGDGLKGLDRLVFLNDSVWFPLPGGSDWLAEAENLGVDFAAAASHFAVKPPKPGKFTDVRWDYSDRYRNFHYASFALSLSQKIIRSESFLRYWRKLRLANQKRSVVRRGEIGLTRWAISGGYSHAMTHDLSHLDRDLDRLSDARLLQIARSLVFLPNKAFTKLWTAVLAEPVYSRERVKAMILTLTARQGASYALTDYLIKDCGFPFLKKSPLRLNHEIPTAMVEIAENLTGPGAEIIRAEVKDIIASRAH